METEQTTPVEEHSFDLPIRSEAELRNFVRLSTGLVFPNVQVCTGHTTPWRAFCDAYFAKSPIAIWEGSRGFSGKSMMLATLGWAEAVTLAAAVNILGGSGQQSLNVHDHIQHFLLHLPSSIHMIEGEPQKRETRFLNGGSIRSLMASGTSVRGPHPQRLRMDEIDEMDLAILKAALGQPMSSNGIAKHTVLSSTHQHPKGPMTEMLSEADLKHWPVYRWCYKETLAPHGWLSASEVESTRTVIPEAMWKAEYDLQEPSFENRAFNTAAVERAFAHPAIEDAPGEYLEFEPPFRGDRDDDGQLARDDRRRVKAYPGEYAHGTDWAQTVDWTIIVTLRTDVRPIRLVAYERCGRVPYPEMTKKLDARIERYGGNSVHDRTGIGAVIHDNLRYGSEGFIMSGLARREMLTAYLSAIEQGLIASPRIKHMFDEHRYATTGELFGDKHLPDTVCAMALAYHATGSHRLPGDLGVTL